MPSGNVDLKIPKDKDRPKVDQIFSSFRKAKPLKIKAVVKEPCHWRPKGDNFYLIKIIAIELVKDDAYYKDYKAAAILIGMNGIEGEFPRHFCWPSKGPKHIVELLFTTYNNMSFRYEEYLTL